MRIPSDKEIRLLDNNCKLIFLYLVLKWATQYKGWTLLVATGCRSASEVDVTRFTYHTKRCMEFDVSPYRHKLKIIE